MELYGKVPFTSWYEPFKKISLLKPPAKVIRNLISDRLVYGGSWDRAASLVETHKIYSRMQDLYAHQDDVRASQTYQEAAHWMEKNGVVSMKGVKLTTHADLQAHLETKYLRLLQSIAQQGYRADLATDIPCAMIGRDGAIIKTHSGRHRFACARLTRPNEPFPLSVAAIHRDWLKGTSSNDLAAVQSKLDNLAEQMC